MISQVRYQVFVSSTYEDLREERQQATQAVLETSRFPSGMELFPASDDTQWELIKRVIEESDYYVIIVAGRYGSLGPEGRSYTEMEYDYAAEKGIPVLGFVRENIGDIPSNTDLRKFLDGSVSLSGPRFDIRHKLWSGRSRSPADRAERANQGAMDGEPVPRRLAGIHDVRQADKHRVGKPMAAQIVPNPCSTGLSSGL